VVEFPGATTGATGARTAATASSTNLERRIGPPQGGSTGAFAVICCGCGDDPALDYRDVPPELQQIRGPRPIAVGVAACDAHRSTLVHVDV
jgi:hypothetical protein